MNLTHGDVHIAEITHLKMYAPRWSVSLNSCLFSLFHPNYEGRTGSLIDDVKHVRRWVLCVHSVKGIQLVFAVDHGNWLVRVRRDGYL
jgi:hypothetical protein